MWQGFLEYEKYGKWKTDGVGAWWGSVWRIQTKQEEKSFAIFIAIKSANL